MAELVPLIGLLVGLGLVVLVKRRPIVGWLALAYFAIAASNPGTFSAVVTFKGVAIYQADILTVVLFFAILFTPGALRRLQPVELLIWGPVVLVLIASIIRGMSTFGLTTAGNEARGLVQVILPTMWVWGRSRLPGFERDLLRWSVLTGLGLTAVALVHIAQRGIGAVDQMILVNGEEVTTRPLLSTQALILGLIGLGFLILRRGAPLKLLGVGFLALAVICEHRSVWAALVVAVAALVVLAPAARRRLVGWVLVVGVAVAVAYSAGLLDPLLVKFAYALHSKGTFTDRQFAWRVLVDQQNAKGGSAILFGQPFGTGFVRTEPGGAVEIFPPHNWYVLLYLRIGLVGAALVVVALARGIWINILRRNALGIAWATGLATYCLAYNLQVYVAPLLAVALTAQVIDRVKDPPEPQESPETLVASPTGQWGRT
jgi:hypothetical protein